MAARLIAITGGIGSGKSYLSAMLRQMGHTVIDTDSLAREIMDNSPDIKARIAAGVHPGAVDGAGRIDRRLLASVVFNDPEKLRRLNSIVHGCVREAILAMSAEAQGLLFVETAIFFDSGLNDMVEAEWRVECPEELRIERTMRRSGLSRAQVRERMDAQRLEARPGERRPPLTLILNDGAAPLRPQIMAALAKSRPCNPAH